jgi:amidase
VLLDGGAVPASIETVLLADDGFAQADDGVVRLLRAALERMEPDLPRIEHRTLAPDGLDPWREAVRIIQAYEIWQVYGDFVQRANPTFGPGVAERMKIASTITAAQAEAANTVRAAARKHLHGLIKPGTVVALPTAPSIAPLIDTPADEIDAHRVKVMRLTCSAGLAGLPQISLPVGTVNGCPAGLSFIGWPGGDEAILDMAFRLSRHCGIAA